MQYDKLLYTVIAETGEAFEESKSLIISFDRSYNENKLRVNSGAMSAAK